MRRPARRSAPRIGLFLLAATWIAAGGAAAIAGPAPHDDTLYSCTVGPREARVSRVGDRLLYTFGRPGRPEISIVGDPRAGTVSYLHALFPHAEHQQLRFRSGAYSYVLYSRFATPSVRTRDGGEDGRGLLVFRGARRIARWDCLGDGWPDDATFGTLPDDGEDITPDPSER